jgi:tRNA modification GTPase
MRAFLNGKIDLAQAEAIQDLIGAKNEEAVRVADDHLAGRLSSRIRELQQQATDVTALFEAWVDFPEDDLGDSLLEGAKRDLATLHHAIAALLATFHDGAIIHDGVTLCILGAPNVGKSSIMNALLGKDRAIVSPIAGTTRDMIEDDLHLNGIHCRLIDTAGIRTSDELIEVEGIKRTRHAMTRADVILAVLDASRPEDTEMYAPLTEVPMEKTVIVWNKIDCAPLPCPVWDLDATQQQREVHLSALTGEGLDQLMHAIERLMWQTGTPRRDEIMITSLRHKEALDRAAAALDRAIHGLEQELSPEFIALDMRDVLRSLGSVIGTDITEDILNSIFSRFCIGK